LQFSSTNGLTCAGYGHCHAGAMQIRRNAVRQPTAAIHDGPPDGLPPIVCVAHLRWDSVFQRPQQLMSRFARDTPVLYLEEALESEEPRHLELRRVAPRLTVAVPRLPRADFDAGPARVAASCRDLLDEALGRWLGRDGPRPVVWYYTPMAMPVAGHVDAELVVYDCMDELSAFAGASPEIKRLEQQLFGRCDLVFTGGRSLFEAKRAHHPRTHLFASSVDVAHFRQARAPGIEPPDMACLARPRIGYYGVIDERLDLPLLEAAAAATPQWQWVLVGPVAKIDPASLPRAANLHAVGARPYAELPAYLRAWDVAIMPFAINAATRFISPTKTPEYLAAGKPVVSTPVRDVVRGYGRSGLVRIAETPAAFVQAVQHALDEPDRDAFLARADALLAGQSWDRTQADMASLMRARRATSAQPDAALGRLSAQRAGSA
jgi:UDP-galactopyranose mutase